MFFETPKQSKLKQLFDKLFPKVHTEYPSVDRIEIKCHDCGQQGIITTYKSMDIYDMPMGWIQVPVRLKHLYLCQDCKDKRRQFGQQLLNNSETI